MAPPIFYVQEGGKMEYKTIIAEASAEFVERRSRFIGHIKPVQTEEDAISFYQSDQVRLLGCHT